MHENSKEKVLSSTSEMEEKVEIYSLAVCGLYDRMINYAGVVHETDRSNYMEMRAMVNFVYATDHYGFNLRKKLSDGTKRETILKALEEEYKETCKVYKDDYLFTLKKNFEHALDADYDQNTFPDMEDRLAFAALRKSVGKRVHSKIVSLAAEGSTKAQILAGRSYFLGWGTPVDVDAGLHWLDTATKSGNGEALLFLGLGYETVCDLETGYRLNPETIKCYEAAYAAGEPEASFALYRYYLDHLSDRTAKSSAKKWMRRGQEEGSVMNLYFSPDEEKRPKKPWVNLNTRNALDWVKAAAALEEPDAYTLLASLYEKGHAGFEKNEEKAEECRKTAFALS